MWSELLLLLWYSLNFFFDVRVNAILGGPPCQSLILHLGIIWRGTEKKTVALSLNHAWLSVVVVLFLVLLLSSSRHYGLFATMEMELEHAFFGLWPPLFFCFCSESNVSICNIFWKRNNVFLFLVPTPGFIFRIFSEMELGWMFRVMFQVKKTSAQ